MSKKENPNIMIILTIFLIVLTIILGILTYLTYQDSKTNTKILGEMEKISESNNQILKKIQDYSEKTANNSERTVTTLEKGNEILTKAFDEGVIGSASSAFWALTYNEATTDLSDDSDGVSSNLAERYRVKIKVDTKLYYVGVVDTTDTTAKINVTTIAGDKEATLSVVDVKKFDVNADNVYDLSITLNGIDLETRKAKISVVYIQEEVPAELQEPTKEQVGEEGALTKSKAWIWIMPIVILLLTILYALKRKKKGKKLS